MNRILYVEDDYINALVITKFLEPQFIVDVASDSVGAWEKLSSHTYDIVLMDISLGNSPDDGPGILKKIQADPRIADLKVVALTAHAMQEDKDKYLNMGFHSYLSKPINRDGLIEHIINALNSSVES